MYLISSGGDVLDHGDEFPVQLRVGFGDGDVAQSGC